MRIDKTNQKNASSLILFLAGWAASPESFRRLAVPEGADLWICHDYRDMAFGEDMAAYGRIHLVAWSLGVWVADLLFPGKQAFHTATAINGTPRPIDDLYGIPRGIFEGTMANDTEQGRLRFNRRMCGDRETLESYAQSPTRPLTEAREELRSLYDRITSLPAPLPRTLPWDTAIIGTDDRIFPVDNLRRYWQGRAAITEIAAPHFPFYTYQSWDELWKR